MVHKFFVEYLYDLGKNFANVGHFINSLCLYHLFLRNGIAMETTPYQRISFTIRMS